MTRSSLHLSLLASLGSLTIGQPSKIFLLHGSLFTIDLDSEGMATESTDTSVRFARARDACKSYNVGSDALIEPVVDWFHLVAAK